MSPTWLRAPHNGFGHFFSPKGVSSPGKPSGFQQGLFAGKRVGLSALGGGVGHNFGVQGGAGEHTQPCTHTPPRHPYGWVMALARQASHVAMTTAASQLGKDRRSPSSPPLPRPDMAQDAGTGSTPVLRPSRQLRVPKAAPQAHS